jgi:N-acyl-D-aspartate/D-glutamate deacylase
MKNTWKVDEARVEASTARLEVTVRIGLFFDGTGNNRFNTQIAADCRAMSEVQGSA